MKIKKYQKGKIIESAAKTVKNIAENLKTAVSKSDITKIVDGTGKIRLRLPSHTVQKPREFVLDPQGSNQFRVHMRTWDGDHIPANLSTADKNALFNAVYNELPVGGEILFPQSGPGYYGTRGTVAGLQRLARDSRFTPTSKGVLQYIDKDGSVKTFEGTGFKKLQMSSNLLEKLKQGGILKAQGGLGKTVKLLEKAANPILRRKLTRQQFTNIINNNGKISPLASEKGSLRFTSVKPRKADFYIETEVPVIKHLPKEIDQPYMFTKGNLSERFQASPEFRPNIYDESVKVFRRNNNGKYELIPKESLSDVNLLSFGVNTRPILTEKPIRLNSHHIHLPEYPTQTNSGFTIYLDEALSPYNQTKLRPSQIIESELYNTGHSYYDPKTRNFITPHGSNNDNIGILKSKINNIQEPSDVAKSLISPAKKYYLEKYDVVDNALSDDEWARLMQTLLEKNSDKEILFHSTYSDYFDKVSKDELMKANEGYLGRGFYTSDIPRSDYGPRIIPFTMPKGKQIVLSTVQSGQKSPVFLHSDNTTVDKVLTSLRKPIVRWSKTGFQPKPWGFWPGMSETSKNPTLWNQFIKDLDLNFIKSTATSKGDGYKYPEILIPENKVDLIEPLFKAPNELKRGGIIKEQI